MLSTPLSGSFTCQTCGKLGWEQQNCSPTASVWEGGSHAFVVVFNPLATRDLAEKHVLKLVEGFFGHCRAV